MSEPRPTLYCWDTDIFLAWLKEEDSAPLADIELIARDIDSKRANLVIPVTVITEVMESRLSGPQRAIWQSFQRRSNVIVASITPEIAAKAAEIRAIGLSLKPKRKIKTPDAQIVATAIIYRCDVLHSLDDRGDGPLRMNGTPLAFGLHICRPISASGQRGLEKF
jgi:predicted nucleic acid-binding protein